MKVMWKQGFIKMLIVLISLTIGMNQSVYAAPAIGTNAKASALIDVQSGRILHSQNGNTPMRIASLTKIMTAIVAIEHGQLTDMVKTSKRAVGREGSSIYLQLGEKMSLSNMLYGLMLRSGNDAATAISEHVGGSEEGFVHLMNEKAVAIGLENTQFQNPHGLDVDGHYSSANDLAKLTAYAMQNDTFAAIVATKVKNVPNPHDEWDYRWANKNKMLYRYEGADGVKTGYTKKSLRCLVSSATRDGQQLVAVTINDGDDWLDHQRLLDWGFHNYHMKQLTMKGTPIAGSSLVTGQSFAYPIEESEQGQIHTKLVPIESNRLEYRWGDRGRLEYYLNDTRIGVIPVYEKDSARTKQPLSGEK